MRNQKERAISKYDHNKNTIVFSVIRKLCSTKYIEAES